MSEAVTRVDFAKKRRGVNRLWLLFGGLALLMPIASLTLLAQAPPARSPAEALAERDAGGQAFAVQCAFCHGPTAEGAIGPALTSPQLRRAPDETTLAQVIRNGIPGTGMPASAVSESQARQISAYVWSLGHRSRSAAHGDVRRGQEIFEGKGRCVQCHTVGGRGGAIGPELADIGARRDVDELRNSLVDPDAAVVVGFVKTRVTTADGTTLTGVRLNEDSFSIQIRDTSNKFHSFWKSELRQIEKELDRSLMPSFRDTLSADEREDVVSYLAIDPDTGTLKWYFQFTPHDVLDMDSNQIPVLADGVFGGRPRKVVLFANRNGFYYILDRTNGEFILGKQFAKQTWALGLDSKGRPIPNPEAVPKVEGTLVYPDDDGTANWFSPSLNPVTGLFYQNVREKGAIQVRSRVDPEYAPGRLFMGGSRRAVPGEEPHGALRALDWKTGELKWEFKVHTPPWCGVLSTAGGVVFSGTMEGDFLALDAVTGKLLWRIQTGGAFWSNPMSYLHEGKQYIAVAAGSSLIAFSLGR